MRSPILGVVAAVLVAAWVLRIAWVQVAITNRRWGSLAGESTLAAHGWPHAPGCLLGGRRLPRRRRRADVVAFTETCARSLRSGSTLLEALEDGGRSDVGLGGGLEADMALLRRRIDSGSSLPAALQRWGEDRHDPDVWLVVSTCRLGHELGGPLAEAFDTIGGAIRARRDVAAEARSLSSQARASAALLVALPVLVGAVAVAFDSSTRQVLLGTPLGWACLAGAVLLDAAGVAWMRRLLASAS